MWASSDTSDRSLAERSLWRVCHTSGIDLPVQGAMSSSAIWGIWNAYLGLVAILAGVVGIWRALFL